MGNIANMFRSGKKHNAFQPFILFYFVVAASFLVIIKTVNDPDTTSLLIKCLVGVSIFGCVLYFLFYLFKADRLQSESYLLEDKKLNMISQKGLEIPINPVNLETQPYKLEKESDNE